MDEDREELGDPVGQQLRDLVGDVLRHARATPLKFDLEPLDAEMVCNGHLLLCELRERQAPEVTAVRGEGAVVVEHLASGSVLEVVADLAENIDPGPGVGLVLVKVSK